MKRSNASNNLKGLVPPLKLSLVQPAQEPALPTPAPQQAQLTLHHVAGIMKNLYLFGALHRSNTYKANLHALGLVNEDKPVRYIKS